MRNQGRLTDKFREIPHHHRRLRSALQHPVGDAGVILDKAVDPQARVHQALEPLGDHPSPEFDGTDFDGAIAAVRRDAAGFKVEDDDGFRAG